MIAGLTAVDGAAVMTDTYELLAFGTKIARRRGSPQVEQVTVTEPVVGGEARTMTPAQLGGTRHLSAAQFVHDQQRRDCARGVAGSPLHGVRLVAVRGPGARASGRDVAAVKHAGFGLRASGFGFHPRGMCRARNRVRRRRRHGGSDTAAIVVTSARHDRTEPVSALAGVVGQPRGIAVGQGAPADARGSARDVGRHPVAASRRRRPPRAARGRRATRSRRRGRDRGDPGRRQPRRAAQRLRPAGHRPSLRAASRWLRRQPDRRVVSGGPRRSGPAAGR